MSAPRWWDGCARAVVRVESFKPIGTGHSVHLLVLECGHKQVAEPTIFADAAICRECAGLRRKEPKP